MSLRRVPSALTDVAAATAAWEFGVQGSGFRVQGFDRRRSSYSGLEIWSSGFRVQGSGVWDLGFRVQEYGI